jgi:hypothetical protein
MSKTFGARVWGGDSTTVAEARRLYTQDPDEWLIRYAVALYSFRAKPRFAEELLWLRPPLLKRAQQVLEAAMRGDLALSLANKVDVLSTHLAWMSRQDGLGGSKRREVRAVALRLCEEATSLIVNVPPGHHTLALIRLTHAELLFEDDEETAGRSYLNGVARKARGITDANQRARVMRKLGALLRRHGRFWRGILWGARACLVRGVPMAVRLKSVAALLGVER